MRVSPSHVVLAAAQQMHCEPDMIRGKSKAHYEARVRRLVYFAGRELGLSSTEIGRYVNRDHSTVIQMTNNRDLSPHERVLVDQIKARSHELAIDKDRRLIDLLQDIKRVKP